MYFFPNHHGGSKSDPSIQDFVQVARKMQPIFLEFLDHEGCQKNHPFLCENQNEHV